MKLNWNDTYVIAELLFDNNPKINPQYIRFTDLHKWICELDSFVGDKDKSNEKVLEAIQMAWIDEYHN